MSLSEWKQNVFDKNTDTKLLYVITFSCSKNAQRQILQFLRMTNLQLVFSAGTGSLFFEKKKGK